MTPSHSSAEYGEPQAADSLPVPSSVGPLAEGGASLPTFTPELEVDRAAFRLITHEQTYVGPLPPPQLLLRYNDALPDGAARILRYAEEEAAHRRALERRMVEF